MALLHLKVSEEMILLRPCLNVGFKIKIVVTLRPSCLKYCQLIMQKLLQASETLHMGTWQESSRINKIAQLK